MLDFIPENFEQNAYFNFTYFLGFYKTWQKNVSARIIENFGCTSPRTLPVDNETLHTKIKTVPGHIPPIPGFPADNETVHTNKLWALAIADI